MTRDVKRLPPGEASQVFLRLAMMAGAGMPLAAAFRSVGQGYGPTVTGSAMADISEKIEGGMYPDEAMSCSGLFQRQACGLVAAGLEAGRLEESLMSLHAYYTRMDRIGRRIRNAVAQPAAMLAMSVLVFLLVCIEILPVFDDVYASMGGALDGLPGALMRAGMWLQRNAALIGAVVLALIAACMGCYMIVPVRSWIVLSFGKAFGDRCVFRQLSDARYVQALSMGLDAGLAPDEASRMAASAQDEGTRARIRYDACSEAMRGGSRLHEACRAAGVIDRSCALIIESGALAGREPDAVREAAAMMLDGAESGLEKLSGLIEPAMTAFGSLLVGLTVLSAMVPLLGVMASLG